MIKKYDFVKIILELAYKRHKSKTGIVGQITKTKEIWVIFNNILCPMVNDCKQCPEIARWDTCHAVADWFDADQLEGISYEESEQFNPARL